VGDSRRRDPHHAAALNIGERVKMSLTDILLIIADALLFILVLRR
jgi:hypothetical protein